MLLLLNRGPVLVLASVRGVARMPANLRWRSRHRIQTRHDPTNSPVQNADYDYDDYPFLSTSCFSLRLK